MKVLIVYGRLYASCLGRAAQALGKNTWTILLPMVLFWVFNFLAVLVGGLPPLIAGFLVALIEAAVGSVYLYFVGEIVGRAKVRLNELGVAIRAYFWSLINLGFVIWIALFVLNAVTGGNPNILMLFNLALLILLNAAPEVIYQVGTYGGLATVQRSIEFLQQSWIEWFLPMILIGVAYYFVWMPIIEQALYQSMPHLVAQLVDAIALGALLHYVMLFRGFLFQELNGSSHRQRMFKYRNAISGR